MKTETKKKYNKPQIAQIRLVVQNPVLANCKSVNPINSDLVETCNWDGAYCADINA